MIDPNAYYSLHYLFKMNVLPFIKTYHTFARIAKNNPDRFHLIKKGQKTGTRYFVIGSDIHKIIEAIGNGALTLDGYIENDI